MGQAEWPQPDPSLERIEDEHHPMVGLHQFHPHPARPAVGVVQQLDAIAGLHAQIGAVGAQREEELPCLDQYLIHMRKIPQAPRP